MEPNVEKRKESKDLEARFGERKENLDKANKMNKTEINGIVVYFVRVWKLEFITIS